MRRALSLLSLLSLLIAAPLSAQMTTPSDIQGASAATAARSTIIHAPPGTSTPPAVAPLASPAAGLIRIRMVTSEGPILIDLEAKKAPLTVANFLRYVDGKRLDGSTIYRVVKAAPNFGFVQGGIQNDPKKILPAVKHEPTSQTGLTHSDGTISLPRGDPGTGHGEFFIVVGDIPSMDADPRQPGDNLGYAAFGHVVQGMDIIRPMIDLPTSPTLGGPSMRGSMLAKPIKIVTVRRVTT